MRLIKFTLATSLCVFLSSCLTYDFTGKTTTQGNLLPEKKIARLHLGMTKQNVAAIMGTSLISPLFQTNRWDYSHTVKPANKAMQIKSLVLTFAQGKLSKIERDSPSGKA